MVNFVQKKFQFGDDRFQNMYKFENLYKFVKITLTKYPDNKAQGELAGEECQHPRRCV